MTGNNVKHLSEVRPPPPPLRSVRGIRMRRFGRELVALGAVALAGIYIAAAGLLLIGGVLMNRASWGVLSLVLWGFVLHRGWKLVEHAIARWTDRADMIVEHRHRREEDH